jgi:hypothetical protein
LIGLINVTGEIFEELDEVGEITMTPDEGDDDDDDDDDDSGTDNTAEFKVDAGEK